MKQLLAFLAIAAVAVAQQTTMLFDASTNGIVRPTLGNFTTANGLVTTASVIDGAHGGTGVANTGKTITLGGNVTTSGAFNLTLTLTGATNVTLPTTGTLVGSADTGTVTNTMLAGSIANAKLGNSTITIAGTSTALGGSISLDTITGLASTGLVKRTGANTLAVATSGTDYAPATSGSSLLYGNGSGGFSSATVGTATGLSFSAGTLSLASVPNSSLANATISIAGTSTALGGSITLDTITGLSSTGIVTRTAANTLTARTITGTAGQVTVTNGDGVSGTPTISLPTALTSVNSVTAASATDFVANGGSSGASLTLGQGANGDLKFDPASGSNGTIVVSSGTNAPVLKFMDGAGTSTQFGAIDGYDLTLRIDGVASAKLTHTGNLLIGGTTDISGSGGLKVFGTTAATSTTSGALQVGTGIGMGGGKIYTSSDVSVGGNLTVTGGTIYGASSIARLGWDGSGTYVADEGGVTRISARSTGVTVASNLTVSGTGTSSFAGPVKYPSYAVASLPSASTSGAGATAYATDLTATTSGTTATGGGSGKHLVTSDGTNWIVQ